MTNSKKRRKIQSTIDILKQDFGECEDYAFGCFQCAVGRIVEDLEDIKELMGGVEKETKTEDSDN